MPRQTREWRRFVAPVLLSGYVALLGALPYLAFAHREGSFKGFKSAYDEDTYLLDDTWAPYRFLSEAIVHLLDFITPGVAALLITTDVVIPVLVVLAAWLLVGRLVEDTAVRILCVLLLLFCQELFSLANSIVWPSRAIEALRELEPHTTLKLFPDATTSYFSLFRTPEPAVSWVLLFGFLALVLDRDPLAAFQGRQRIVTISIFGLLGFAYPFSSLPIIFVTSSLFAWALAYERRRAAAVGVALLTALASYVLAWFISGLGDSVNETSFLFPSRFPVISPAVVAGIGVAAGFVMLHGGDVLRRPQLLIPFVASLFPAAITNQQLVTGMMVSARDWERYTNYALVVVALICLVGSSKRRRFAGERRPADIRFRLAAWLAVVFLVIQIFSWQRDVYRVWTSTNVEAHEIADLLDAVTGPNTAYPVALENAGLAPLVRVLTDNEYRFVLDYTRLFADPVPSFADGTRADQLGPRRGELFAHAYRVGWSPDRLGRQIRSELEGDAGGFYAHFVFALSDVWPPLTDNRRLRTDEALRRVPAITAAYSEYLEKLARSDPGPAVIVTRQRLAKAGKGRRNELIATSAESETSGRLRLYLQTSER